MAPSWSTVACVLGASLCGCSPKANLVSAAVDAIGSIHVIDRIVADALPIVRAPSAAIAADANLGADSVMSSAAAAITSTLSWTGFARGDGSANSPLQVEQSSASPEITLSYINAGDGQAIDFATTVGALPAGWRVAAHGCDEITLQRASTCSDTYELDTSASGRADFDVGNSITASWISQGRSSNDQAIAGVATIYVAVIEAASIFVSTDGLSEGKVLQGDSFDLVVNLTGGIDVSPQLVEFNNISPYNAGFSHTGPCSVSSQQPTCIITIDVATTVPAGTYSAFIRNNNSVAVRVGAAPFSVAEF